MAERVPENTIVVVIGSRVHQPLVPGESYMTSDGDGRPVHLDLAEVIQATVTLDPDGLKKYLSGSKVKGAVIELAEQRFGEEVWNKSMTHLRGA